MLDWLAPPSILRYPAGLKKNLTRGTRWAGYARAAMLILAASGVKNRLKPELRTAFDACRESLFTQGLPNH